MTVSERKIDENSGDNSTYCDACIDYDIGYHVPGAGRVGRFRVVFMINDSG